MELNKTIDKIPYEIKGQIEFNHQSGWRFIESKTTVMDRGIVASDLQKKFVLSNITSNELSKNRN